MQEQQEKTFVKRLEDGRKKAEASLRKLGAREFACEPDARLVARKWLQKHPLFCFTLMGRSSQYSRNHDAACQVNQSHE
jgi:transposase